MMFMTNNTHFYVLTNLMEVGEFIFLINKFSFSSVISTTAPPPHPPKKTLGFVICPTIFVPPFFQSSLRLLPPSNSLPLPTPPLPLSHLPPSLPSFLSSCLLTLLQSVLPSICFSICPSILSSYPPPLLPSFL